jgi:hypothetical protein
MQDALQEEDDEELDDDEEALILDHGDEGLYRFRPYSPRV